jgi:hypothetical protein
MSSATELSETDDDLKWQRIINDPRPRPQLSALGDEIEKQFKVILPTGRDRQNLRPSLYHLLQVLGKERVLARIERALTTMD